MENNLSAIYTKFKAPIYRYIRYKITDKHLAEDLTQEVFIKAGKSIDSLKEGEKIQSWLYSIATNTIFDHFRKKNLPFIAEYDLAVDNTDEQSVLNELTCCLNEYIGQLKPIEKEILQAIYIKEYTIKEYSEYSNINLSTVKSHARRAKQSLKKLFDNCCNFEINTHGEIVDFHKNNKTT